MYRHGAPIHDADAVSDPVRRGGHRRRHRRRGLRSSSSRLPPPPSRGPIQFVASVPPPTSRGLRSCSSRLPPPPSRGLRSSSSRGLRSRKVAPRAPPRVPRRTVAETDREFDELTSALSKDPRDQLTSGAGQIATRLRSYSCQTNNARDQVDSDVAMDENNQINAAAHNTEGPAKSGRKVTINNQLRERRAKGNHIGIKFPKEFAKVCGEHASLFKSEITVLVRTVPLQVKKWKNMDEFHPGTTTSIWRKLKQKFPELSEEDKDCAMKQVESQYNNRRYRLLQAYRNNKPKPQHVSPEGWQWLIRNLWTDDDFQKRSNQNSINRGKQEMGSKIGTRSIAQIAYDLRDPETGEWPTAMQVWRATYQKADGTWSIPNGEEIMTKLDEAAGIHQEKIASAPVPIVEHFALVLGRKPNHSRGVGIRAVNKVAEEKKSDCMRKLRLLNSMKLQLEHVQMLLSNVLRLLSNEHKLWKVKFPRWLKRMHNCKKSSKPSVMR